MSKPITISVKNLAALNMPDSCDRCFWIKHNQKKLPFQIFPGIFSSLDSIQKKIVEGHITKYGIAPPWYPSQQLITSFTKVPHYSKFYRFDEGTGIIIRGGPDLILNCIDGEFIIDDLKTAKYTANADKLFPLYEAQLNGYRWIHEGYGKITKSTRLIYFEPVSDIAEVDHNITTNGFLMDLTCHPLEVTRQPDLIPNLLKKAKSILDHEKPPEPTAGCKDCAAVSEMVELLKVA